MGGELKHLCFAAAWGSAPMLLGAFARWQINVAHWSPEARLFFGLFSAGLFALVYFTREHE